MPCSHDSDDDDLRVTPATLRAAADGHMGNLLASMLPGGIEAQEAAGQRELTAHADRLPVEGTISRPELRAQWESAGFVFGTPIPEPSQRNREVFIACTFPAGWKLKPTEHSMWSDLIDAAGRKRAAVFFKAAFYDYNAHTFGLEPRYSVGGTYTGSPDFALTAFVVNDADKPGAHLHTVSVPAGTDYSGRDAYREQAAKWLAEQFPNHADPLAYWN